MTPLGLTTYQWNNNIKSILLVAAFPCLLFGLMFAGACLIAFLFSTPQGTIDPVIVSDFGFSPDSFPSNSVDFAIELCLNVAPYVIGFAVLWILIGSLFHEGVIRLATGARTVTRMEEPVLFNLLENLCISRGMTMPKLFMINTPVKNAYASGLTEKSYAITVTRGLTESLEKDELEAVLAHELSHIRHRDVRLLIVTILFGGLLSFFADMAWRSLRYTPNSTDRRGRNALPIMLGIALILSIGYLASMVFRFALSRRREYLADAGAVELTKNPGGLIRALQKISGHAEMPDVSNNVRAMMIENPPGLFGLLATHPPIEERIAVLRRLSGEPARGESIIPTVS